MRLWTVHPRYLDSKGLLAAWREGLLAQKVLRGATKGYTHHPQLIRFKEQKDPAAAIGAFLGGLAAEAKIRGYSFDDSKIINRGFGGKIPETEGQLRYEWGHLKAKLRVRAPALLQRFGENHLPVPHPLFNIIPGEVRTWEKR